MGGPLSGSLADIFLASIEIQQLCAFKESILLYHRYMDDILVVATDNAQGNELITTFFKRLQENFNLAITLEPSPRQVIFLNLCLQVSQ